MINASVPAYMNTTSKIPLFYGLNIQFVVYFVLFAYVPLLVISIFGYYMNKNMLKESYQRNLIEINRILNQRLVSLFEENVSGFSAEGAENVNLVPAQGRDSLIVLYSGNGETKEGRLAVRKLQSKLSTPDPSFLYILHDPASGVSITHDSLQTGLRSMSENYTGIMPLESDPEIRTDVFPGLILYSGRVGAGLYAELREFLIEIIISNIIIGLLMLTIAILLARRISRPIRSLITAVHEISQGDLSRPVRIRSKDEIKLLADEFEMMRQKLLESYSNLENKIEARTKQLKEAQFQISHQEKMASLGLMAAGIAHEIGNPLTSISSMAQIIRRKTSDKHIAGFITTIVKNIERISKIVRELVDFARPSSYEAAWIDVNEVIRNAVGIVRYDRRAKHINIQLDLEPELPELYLVEDQLYQVFFNILINAVDAMGEKKDKIAVRSYRKNSDLHIQFRDTGTGIPPEEQNKIFEPFYTTKGVGKGTGLGLSVSYGIIKNLNGEIRLESEVGKGSVFTVILPVNSQEAASES